MAIRILRWEMRPGRDIPDPILEDDSNLYQVDEVKQVREWLASTKDSFKDQPPTPITIFCGGPTPETGGRVEYSQKDSKMNHIRNTFTHGTIEVILRSKCANKIPIVKYQYVAAMAFDGRMIVGPEISREVVGQLSV